MRSPKVNVWKAVLLLIPLVVSTREAKSQTNQPFHDTSLSVVKRTQDLLNRLTIDEKISLLTETAPAILRVGIDKYYHGNEGLHGVVRPGKCTVFPQAMALASS